MRRDSSRSSLDFSDGEQELFEVSEQAELVQPPDDEDEDTAKKKKKKAKPLPDFKKLLGSEEYSGAAERLHAAIRIGSPSERHWVFFSNMFKLPQIDTGLKEVTRKEGVHALRQEGEEEEEEAFEEDSEGGGLGVSQLASVARMLSRGGEATAGGLEGIMDSDYLASNLESVVEYSLKKLREQWRTLLHGLFPVAHLQTMLLVCVVQLITVERLLRVLPIAASYVAFAAMTYATLRMFHSRRVLRQYQVWKRLLVVFSAGDKSPEKSASPTRSTRRSSQGSNASSTEHIPDAEAETAETSQYQMENWEPYVGFFLSTIVFILAFGLCGKYIPNCLILCGVSFFFCLFCFVGLTDEMDWMALVAFILNITAHLPIVMKKLRLGRWALFQELAAPRILGMRVSIGFGSLAFLLIPVLYALACIGRSRQDIIRLLVPQLVCFVWSDTGLTLFMAGFVGFELGSILLTAGIIFFLLFPTGAGLVVVAAVFVAQLKGSIGLAAALKALSILGLLLLPLAYKSLHAALTKRFGQLPDLVSGVRETSRRTQLFLAAGLYGVLVLASIALLYHGSALGPGLQREVTNLSWTQFEKTCGLAPKGDDNQVEKQVQCSQLKGLAVRWKGSIQTVRVAKIDNSLESLLDYFPMALAEWLRCFYGGSASEVRAGWDGLDTQSCSLSQHHWYTFEVEVMGPFGDRLISSNKGTVILTASHVFHPLLVNLREADVVKFLAYFDSYPVTKWTPKLRLLHMSCSTCKFISDAKGQPRPGPESPDYIPSELADLSLSAGFWSRLVYAFKFLFNFAFSPALYLST